MKKVVMIFFALLFVSNLVVAGNCDISSWRIINDDGSVASVVATIDGVTYDFVTKSYSDGVERLFYRTSGLTSTSSVSSSDAVVIIDSFLSYHKNNLGITNFGNIKYESTSDSNYIISADYYINVDPNLCEGISYITGIIYFSVDAQGNIISINPKIQLTFGLTNEPPSLSGGSFGGGGSGGGGGAGSAGGGGAGASKPNVENPSAENQVETPDISNLPQVPNTNYYPAKKSILGLSFAIIPIFLMVLFLFLFIGLKKHVRIK